MKTSAARQARNYVRDSCSLGFEGVVVFVLNLPSGTSRSNNLFYGLVSDCVIGGKGVIDDLAIRSSNDQFAPIPPSASSPSRWGTWLSSR